MKSANRSNALLVELLIVVLFFMLSATVLLQVFSTARSQSGLAGKLIQASNAAQDVSDRLYSAGDAESALKEMGWTREDDGWYLPGDEYDLTVSLTREQQPSGELLRYQVRAVSDGQTLIDLPGARYQEAAE